MLRSQFSASLRELRLRGCGLTYLAAHLLAEARGAWPLRELDVSHNAIGPAGLDALRGRFGDAVVADGPEAA